MQYNAKNQSGVVIILIILIISLLLLLGLFFLSISMTEQLIAKSQASGVNSYYLAEAGINEMIWLMVNNPLYENNFMYNDNWSTSTTRLDPFGAGSGSYTVIASNTSAAHCEIIATGLYDVGGGNYSQRILKTDLFRAVGTSTSVIGDNAGYADGNITVTNSYVNFLNGSAHSNNTFDVNNQNVQIMVNSDLRAVGNYLEHSNASTTISGWIYAANWASYANGTGTIPAMIMPAVDFNSSDPSSYKNQAISSGSYYTESDFDDELCSNMGGSIVLTKKVTYIGGGVSLNGPIELKYPPTGGILVVEDDFIVGAKSYKKCGVNMYGKPDITFNYVAGKPSGILVGKKVRFLANTGHVYVEGIIYSNAEMDISSLDTTTSSFYVKGGAIGQKFDIDSCYGWLTIEHDVNVLVDTLGPASSSPTIIIEHWEEEY
ncbi:hypothetical protein KAJ89_03185 [Candidatus Parcubacteria bacterium]|nr:hypothetical protein [Candidatus Parcubacteria bacterium]